MKAVTCCHKECGIDFWVPDGWYNLRQHDGVRFTCPNGHSQWFGESSEDELRQERDRLKQRLAQKDDEIAEEREKKNAARRSLRAQKGQVTRLKNRVKAGVCPCCNRSFLNLRRHMDNKHPEYATDAEPDLTVVQGGKSSGESR